MNSVFNTSGETAGLQAMWRNMMRRAGRIYHVAEHANNMGMLGVCWKLVDCRAFRRLARFR